MGYVILFSKVIFCFTFLLHKIPEERIIRTDLIGTLIDSSGSISMASTAIEIQFFAVEKKRGGSNHISVYFRRVNFIFELHIHN